MYGSVRSQLMQVYVQKSTSTTFPARLGGGRRGEFSHSAAPPMAANSRGARWFASTLRDTPRWAPAIVIAAVPRKRRRSRSILSVSAAGVLIIWFIAFFLFEIGGRMTRTRGAP